MTSEATELPLTPSSPLTPPETAAAVGKDEDETKFLLADKPASCDLQIEKDQQIVPNLLDSNPGLRALLTAPSSLLREKLLSTNTPPHCDSVDTDAVPPDPVDPPGPDTKPEQPVDLSTTSTSHVSEKDAEQSPPPLQIVEPKQEAIDPEEASELLDSAALAEGVADKCVVSNQENQTNGVEELNNAAKEVKTATEETAGDLPTEPPPAQPSSPAKGHGSRRVFQCSSCNTYYEDWNLFLHMRNVHSRFICLLCLGLFPNAKRLAKHLLNRHGQKDQQFETTGDMMEWNKNRPCHLMCVNCETVEECVDASTEHVHECSHAAQGEKRSAKPKTETMQIGINSATPVGPARTKGSKKKQSQHAPMTPSSLSLSSDLVAEASPLGGGFKLKIKGLARRGSETLSVAVNDEEQENESRGAVEEQREEADRPSSFNFILSKKGLVRNPNPSLSSGKKTHSQDGAEEVEDRPPLVSKLKLKIPKFVVPVESEEEEDESEEEEEDEEEEDDEDEENEESESQFRPVKDEESQEQGMDVDQPAEATSIPGDKTAVDKEKEAVVVKEESGLDRTNRNSNDEESSSVGASGNEGDKPSAPDEVMKEVQSSSQGVDETKEATDPTDKPLSVSQDIKPDPSEAKGESTSDAPVESKTPEPIIDEDGLQIADTNSQSFELSLDQPLDHIPVKDFLRTCLRATIPFCLYCYHARRIAVNAKMLAVHMIATHRFTALVDSITAEELMPETIVARLKGSLDDLEHIYFNLDDYDSEVVAPLKMKAKIFECFQCRFTTGTHKELYLHNRKLHLKTVLLCLMCRSTFYNYSELLCHICPGNGIMK